MVTAFICFCLTVDFRVNFILFIFWFFIFFDYSFAIFEEAE